MHRRRILKTVPVIGLGAIAGCADSTDTSDDGTDTDGGSEPDPVDDPDTGTGDGSFFRLTQTADTTFPAGETRLTIECRVAGFTTDRIEHVTDTDFGPGDQLSVYRTSNGLVSYRFGDPPSDRQRLDRLTNVTFQALPGGSARFSSGFVNVGLSSLQASFIVEVVNPELVRVDHEAGDVFPTGQTAVSLRRDSVNGISVSNFRLDSRFAPGDSAWVYLDDTDSPTLSVGSQPATDYPVTGDISITFIDPLENVIDELSIFVGSNQ